MCVSLYSDRNCGLSVFLPVNLLLHAGQELVDHGRVAAFQDLHEKVGVLAKSVQVALRAPVLTDQFLGA